MAITAPTNLFAPGSAAATALITGMAYGEVVTLCLKAGAQTDLVNARPIVIEWQDSDGNWQAATSMSRSLMAVEFVWRGPSRVTRAASNVVGFGVDQR